MDQEFRVTGGKSGYKATSEDEKKKRRERCFLLQREQEAGVMKHARVIT